MDSWVPSSLLRLPNTQRTKTQALKGLQSLAQLSNILWSHLFYSHGAPATLALPPSLSREVCSWWQPHLGALSPSFAQLSSFRSSFAYHFLWGDFLTYVSELSPSLSVQQSQISSFGAFFWICDYLFICVIMWWMSVSNYTLSPLRAGTAVSHTGIARNVPRNCVLFIEEVSKVLTIWLVWRGSCVFVGFLLFNLKNCGKFQMCIKVGRTIHWASIYL